MGQDLKELKDFLDEKVAQYNNPTFIGLDPIQIPHSYTRKEDIEISGFLSATISWGNRTSIVRNAIRMLAFVHRTFNSVDLLTFIEGLKHLYKHNNGLEGVFVKYQTNDSLQPAIHELKKESFNISHLERTRKHLPDPMTGSAAKKINMLIRIIKVAINQNKLIHLALIQ